jgi:uncharacterized cupredoxin-like copper-binding protein
MRRFIAVLIAAFAVTGTAVAGFSAAGVVGGKSTQHAMAETTITVQAYEFNFTLSQNSAPTGIVHFVVTNTGTQEHDFAIAGQKTPTLAVGQTATLTVTFNNPGQYNYACTIGEHASFGMQGLFTVTGQPVTTTQVITTNGTTITTTATTTQTTTGGAPTTVPVSEKEFKILLPSVKKRVTYYVRVKGKRVKKHKTVLVQKPVKAGPLKFVVKNIGKIPHNFVIGDQQSLVIKPGETTTVTITLSKGKHRYECSITGHAALGMKGTLVVV